MFTFRKESEIETGVKVRLEESCLLVIKVV
ncbi:uncharacterized protein METZ01_LOCUS464831 [marine metagenome]|uniref:Uncharacterized protein n=1 Tax=marine metagenome TaxID=408172 RepID=A0A383AVW2_9ZZZZ